MFIFVQVLGLGQGTGKLHLLHGDKACGPFFSVCQLLMGPSEKVLGRDGLDCGMLDQETSTCCGFSGLTGETLQI